MGIFRGTMAYTNDVTIAIQSSLEGCKVLYLGDPCGENDIISNYGFIISTPLIPEYNLLVKDVEGYKDEFDLEYVDMLGSDQSACMIFASILSAMLKGMNILLYFPVNVSDFRYPTVLIQYITQQYGIIPASIENMYGYFDRYDDSNLLFMYSYGTINHIDFLVNYNGPLEPQLIDQLTMQISPKLNNMYDYNEKYNVIMSKKKEYIDIILNGGYPIDACKHQL